MTVADLIKLLRDCPPDVEVMTEGCDCYGDIVEAQPREGSDGPYILLMRSDGELRSKP